MAGAGEDQHRVGVGLLEQLEQQGRLQVLRHRVEGVRHGLDRAAEANGDPLRVAQGLGGQLLRLSGGKVAEKSMVWRRAGTCLRMRWTEGKKPMSNMRSASSSTSTSTPSRAWRCPGSMMVQQAARAGHQDFDPVAQGPHLGLRDRRRRKWWRCGWRAAGQVADAVVDLFGQLAGGGNDQGAGAVTRAGQQALENGQDESGRFTGAGLGGADQVLPGQGRGNGGGLNGGGSV